MIYGRWLGGCTNHVATGGKKGGPAEGDNDELASTRNNQLTPRTGGFERGAFVLTVFSLLLSVTSDWVDMVAALGSGPIEMKQGQVEVTGEIERNESI
jgi:hypothetical protein